MYELFILIISVCIVILLCKMQQPYNEIIYSETEYTLRKNRGYPVPVGAFKETNDIYVKGWPPYSRMENTRRYDDIVRPNKSDDYFLPFPRRSMGREGNWVSSVSAYLPFPEVNTANEKAGIFVRVDSPSQEILNFYRRPIAPMQDLWENTVQDKDGFIIYLEDKKLIEDGDVIEHITGKDGKWKAHVYVKNKYVYM